MASSLDELTQRINILDVLERAGARTRMADSWDDEVQVWCPFCDDIHSRKPAGRANVMTGVYFCYSCGFGAGVIGVAHRYLKDNETPDPFWGSYVGFDTAIDWLQENWPADATEAEEDPWTD